VPFDDPIFNHGCWAAVGQAFLGRLLALPPEERERLLGPAFAEVEWALVVLAEKRKASFRKHCFFH